MVIISTSGVFVSFHTIPVLINRFLVSVISTCLDFQVTSWIPNWIIYWIVAKTFVTLSTAYMTLCEQKINWKRVVYLQPQKPSPCHSQSYLVVWKTSHSFIFSHIREEVLKIREIDDANFLMDGCAVLPKNNEVKIDAKRESCSD